MNHTKHSFFRSPDLKLFSALLSFLFLLPQFCFGEVVDKVVAVVNDDIITLSELEAETAAMYQSIARNNSNGSVAEALDAARDAALNSMIEQRLVEQRARLYNVSVSEEEINGAFSQTRAKAGLNPSEFRKKLLESGLNEEQYRKKIRASILQSKLLNVDVRSRVVITDQMILDYYDENYTSRVEGDKYYLLQIGFNAGEDGAEALKTAQRVRKLALNGQNFENLAIKFSELPSASDGGDIGIFAIDEMAPFMKSAITNLKPGGISDIVETPEGYQFFKLLSGDDSEIVVTAPYDEVEDKIREQLFNQKMETAFQTWVKDLKDKAYIQKL
jgi:peptidyl-prolyl cis-trans isomerase SurA